MKRFILLLLLFSCGHKQAAKMDQTDLTDKSDNGLYPLLEKLPALKKPLTFCSNKQITGDSLLTISDELIKNIQTIDPAFNPYGKIYQTNDYIAIIAIGAADIVMPILATYDKKGKLIDSFSMYPTAGGDMGYYSTNIITLTENKELLLTDSVLTRKLNSDETNEIPGTDSLSVTRKKYRINDNGKIEEIR